ncbi:UNVERIFIED_CONTAM: hypothetical protein Slati_3126700 [Sesamum latifolium]|uniref:Uncharacterized protein n=1 Tax=Sesamum latifolium TaxID=2727402 RepID=A0AAW2UWP0_9LAMI
MFIDIRYLRPWATLVINEAESSSLVGPVTQEDVKAAFFYIEEDRSPRSDGYSVGFYKAAWLIIGDEITRAVLNFFLHGRLLKQVNVTLLALILKVQLSATVANFRHISYCNVLYKVITKIMVQRL